MSSSSALIILAFASLYRAGRPARESDVDYTHTHYTDAYLILQPVWLPKQIAKLQELVMGMLFMEE